MTSTGLFRLTLCCAALLTGYAAAVEAPHTTVDRYMLFGFGPFSGRGENGSWQSLKQFSEGTQVRSHEVPVIWGAPRTKLMELTKAEGKVVLVALGEGTSTYEVETVGFNERGDIRDEAGEHPTNNAIRAGGASRLEVTAPAAALAEKLNARGFPARTSKDAGRFLCNEMLYELLQLQQENPAVAAVYFIHVPILGAETDRGAERIRVTHEYCASFGQALVATLRELHPLVETTTASAR